MAAGKLLSIVIKTYHIFTTCLRTHNDKDFGESNHNYSKAFCSNSHKRAKLIYT